VHSHHAHPEGGHGFDAGMSVLLGATIVALVLYLYGVARARRAGRRWSLSRSAGFVVGAGLVSGSLLPPVAALGHGDLRAHMAQHLMLGMLGPIGLVLGAPVTLALRTLPPPRARQLVALLRARPIHWLSHPVTALILNIGGMAVLYATPLFALMMTDPRLHLAVHFHFLAAGCLFAWSIAGTDPGPARPSHATRLVVLFVAIAAHATLAKAMYAQGWPRGTAFARSEIEQAAKIMYYGGDLSELLLAIALFASWRHARRGRVCPGELGTASSPRPQLHQSEAVSQAAR
jgi:putative membrane protein